MSLPVNWWNVKLGWIKVLDSIYKDVSQIQIQIGRDSLTNLTETLQMPLLMRNMKTEEIVEIMLDQRTLWTACHSLAGATT